jgi:hypothetical protein
MEKVPLKMKVVIRTVQFIHWISKRKDLFAPSNTCPPHIKEYAKKCNISIE